MCPAQLNQGDQASNRTNCQSQSVDRASIKARAVQNRDPVDFWPSTQEGSDPHCARQSVSCEGYYQPNAQQCSQRHADQNSASNDAANPKYQDCYCANRH
jgi:hypothetical protein